MFLPVVAAQMPATITSYTCDAAPTLNHTFDYTTDYDANGWTLSTCTFAPDYSPQDNPYLGRSFGVNVTGGNTINCGAATDFYHTISRDISVISSGLVLYEFDYIFHNDSEISGNVQRMRSNVVNSGGGAHGFTLSMNQAAASSVISIANSGSANVESCTGTTAILNETSYHVSVLIDLDNSLYSVYVNDSVDSGCANKSLGVMTEVSRITYSHGFDDDEYSNLESDNLLVCQTLALADATSGDAEDRLQDMLEDEFHLRTTKTRYLAGILMLLIFSIVFVSDTIAVTHKFEAGAGIGLLITDILLSILLTYLRLLPLWIPIVIVLLTIGFASLTGVKNAAT